MRDDGELVGMDECGYDSEALLQEYLARHHDLLAGDQIDGESPKRWLLVSQEMSLSSEANGSRRWSVDHLFLDQDAVPTIVETKRSTDTRIRREVVGQMLDYAANGVSYWDVGVLRERFESNAESEEALFDILENRDADPDEFWRNVERNLQAGKVRLVFVSDHIPDELRRVVEFLNEQMNPAEVLAVEIKQYVSDDSNMRTFVPRVIGQTTKAKDHKSGGVQRGKSWDETSFLEALEVNRGSEEAVLAARIAEWSRTELPRFEWSTAGTFWPCLDHKGTSYWPIGIRIDGQIEVIFQWLKPRPPFTDEAKRRELLNQFNSIEGVDLPVNHATGRPKFPLSALQDERSLEKFYETLEWFVKEVKATQEISADHG